MELYKVVIITERKTNKCKAIIKNISKRCKPHKKNVIVSVNNKKTQMIQHAQMRVTFS